MLSRRLLTLSLLLTGVSAYLYFFEHLSWCVWPLGAGILLAMSAFIFEHQINWMWYRKHPPSLHPEMQKMYLRAGKFYTSLDDVSRKKFDTRANLYVEANEFISQGLSEVPEDVKYMIAYYAVMISFSKEDYLFDPYRRIVIYLHPFLTPNLPDHVHTYELEHEDGTILFALEQLTAGFVNPAKYYQIGLHAYAELYTARYLRDQKVTDPEARWALLTEIGGWSRQRIEDFTGMPQESPVPVMLHHWFAHREKMSGVDPEMYRMIERWLM